MLRRLFPFAIAAAVFVLDRITKWIIQTRVTAWDSLVVIPDFFNIVHAENRGAAFGIFSESSGVWHKFLLIGLSLAVLIFIGAMLWQQRSTSFRRQWILRAGLGLVLGGALGNVYDRIATGTVTDFLEFYIGDHQFPSFNVADSAITTGAGLLLLDMWRSRERKSSGAGERQKI
ncbi:MAG: signal peptidase II [Bryobacteraceae bacterium]